MGKMHMGMAINFTGDAALDFVRGMIPHHQGALDMCEVLMGNLTCKDSEDLGALDGIVHFCNHVRVEQEWELAGMRKWLAARGQGEQATCKSSHATSNKHGGSGGSGGSGGRRLGQKTTDHGMSMGCGNTSSASSKRFMHANELMHAGMGVKFSCKHDIDFTRAMIP